MPSRSSRCQCWDVTALRGGWMLGDTQFQHLRPWLRPGLCACTLCLGPCTRTLCLGPCARTPCPRMHPHTWALVLALDILFTSSHRDVHSCSDFTIATTWLIPCCSISLPFYFTVDYCLSLIIYLPHVPPFIIMAPLYYFRPIHYLYPYLSRDPHPFLFGSPAR